MIQKILAMGIVAMALLGSGCSALPKDTTNWYIDVAAPEYYGVWVTDMFLEKSGERSWRQPIGIVSCCWRGAYGPVGKGARVEPFPELILVNWFSFAEQKYYTKIIQVPEDLLDRMREPATYKTPMGVYSGPRNFMTIGLAPGGTVVVWISNQIGNEIEVMRMQATELPGDPSRFTERTKGYLERNGDYLREHGVPTEGW
ncbi:DUF2931 family protein [Marinobacter nauticus]|uniref:DUF2931 family protein n=1 Tax=Marinobacter nauticus TaxID=2743 RepID=UPI001C9940F7|nr:DUF2931 family protein [Marinobacter nauticus]MBY5937000.1 DUF2931 family protein [Marinobacter nauticus]MBY5954757.1 DUF2931 family protein [Marinobacter nauticus]MBY6008021.1 DUF2931 family protein [Marinobacter nauticus]